MRISAFFVGELHDSGFNASALAGVEAERSNPRHAISVVSGVPYDEAVMAARLTETAERADFVIFIGGQGDRITPRVAERFPDTRFAVIQGSVAAPNLFSYEVRQEESAFLAGVFAAHFTRTGVIGHLSGHRVKPGLKGRAAYVAGAKFANDDVMVLTSFCGTQDDSRVTRDWATAQIGDRADVIFTMLNGARAGAIEACRASGIRQVGNATDWCVAMPDVFAASAVARIDLAVRRAIADADHRESPRDKIEIGLRDGDAVQLTFADDVGADIRAKVGAVESALKASRVSIPEVYDGPEYQADVAR